MMMTIFLCGDCGAYRCTQGTAEDRAIPTTDFVADRRSGRATKTTTNGRIQSRTTCIDIRRKDDHR